MNNVLQVQNDCEKIYVEKKRNDSCEQSESWAGGNHTLNESHGGGKSCSNK